MTTRTWLVDKSALLRLDTAPDSDEWDRRVERGLLRVATVTVLEMGFSARTAADHRDSLGTPPISLMPVEYLTPGSERRVVQVQGLLAERGQHRAPSIPDLLIAAIAEEAGHTVLHVDKDFELIAEVTGQPVERLAV